MNFTPPYTHQLLQNVRINLKVKFKKYLLVVLTDNLIKRVELVEDCSDRKNAKNNKN